MKYSYHGPMHAITIRNPKEPDDKPQDDVFEGTLYPGCTVDLPDTLPLVVTWVARGWLIALPDMPVNQTAPQPQPAAGPQPQPAAAGNNP